MILTLIHNNSYISVKADIEAQFDKDFSTIKNILDVNEGKVHACLTDLNAMNKGGIVLKEDYDEFLSVMPENYFNGGKEITGYFYVIEDEDKTSSWFYDSGSGVLTDLYLSGNEDVFKDNEIKVEKWSYFKDKDSKISHLVYVMPIICNYEEIGYFGCVLNLYFIENSYFYDNINEAHSLYFVNNEGQFMFKKGLEEYDNISQLEEDRLNKFNEILKTANNKEDSNLISAFDAFIYRNISEDLTLIRQINIFEYQRDINILVIYVTVLMLVCFFVYHEAKESDDKRLTSVLQKYISKITKNSFSVYELKNKVSYSNMIFLIVLIILTTIYALVTDKNFYPSLMFLALCLVALTRYTVSQIDEENDDKKAKVKTILNGIVDVILAIIPGVFLFFLSDKDNFTAILVLLIAVVIIVMGVFYGGYSRKTHLYYLPLAFLVVVQYLSALFDKREILGDIYIFTAYVAFIGLVTNVLFIVFKAYTDKNNDEMVALVDKVQSTQEMLVQKERMATLGQLMAGICHEVNTPIGAIKASADTFNVKLVDSIKAMVDSSKNYSSDDEAALFKLVELSFESVKKMRTTSELRKAKEDVYDYLISQGIEDDAAYNIAHTLSRIEICDLDKIEEIIEILKKDNIEDILRDVCDLFFLLTGTNTIQLATNKISKIMYALRAYSNISVSSVMSEFEIEKCIDNIITLYTSQFSIPITINRIYQDRNRAIIGNTEGLGQVCTNIIQNAFYAMKDEGGTLNISIKTDDENVYVDFTDTGCGIPEENIDKIFEPLFTTKPLGEGSGLGLGICRKIIENHNGSISIKSEVGKGTTVSITLPLTQSSTKEE